MDTYTVQTGDTLFLIAKKFYGDGYTYQLLAAYNHIRNPNAVPVGQVLNIPPLKELQSAGSPLRDWHNYGDGAIFWRVTSRGIEIKGQGLPKVTRYTTQAASIWKTYRQPIVTASQKHGVPIAAMIATIITESSGKPNAYRYEPEFYERYIKDNPTWQKDSTYSAAEKIAASYGLMQIMYTTACSVGFQGTPEQLYDPATNIDVSAAYIASPFQKKQHQWDPPKIACAYNAGSVRASKKNEWGMFYHPGHLDRWIPSYNGAIEVLEKEHLSPHLEPVEPKDDTPPPTTPVKPTKPETAALSTIRVIFPAPAQGAWATVIVDVFKHTDHGLGDAVSYAITKPTPGPGGNYMYDIPKLAKGTYDLVFADARSCAILYEMANYQLTTTQATLDLSQSRTSRAIADAPIQVIFQFPKEMGQSWRAMLLEVFAHSGNTPDEPLTSSSMKKLSSGPEGDYGYTLSALESGVYDFVLTDIASRTVLQKIAGYVVEQTPEMIDLRNNRGLINEYAQLIAQESFGAKVRTLLRKLLTWMTGE